MRYRKGRGDGNSLMQVAAAVVGSAAASQVINPDQVIRHLYQPGPDGLCTTGVAYGRRQGVIRCGEPADHPDHGEPARDTPQPCCPDHDPDGVEDIQCCDDCPADADEEGPSADDRQVVSLKARIVDQDYALDAFQLESGAARDAGPEAGVRAVRQMAAEVEGLRSEAETLRRGAAELGHQRLADQVEMMRMRARIAELEQAAPVAAAEDADARNRPGGEWDRVYPVGAAALRAVRAAALDVHAALNTYEVAAGVPQACEDAAPNMVRVIGANHRRLIARWDADGLWIGGCLITDRAVAERLASFITREGEDV